MIRLNRYLASCGLGARRKCEALIQSGRVEVNHNVVTNLATQVDEKLDAVFVDGKQVHVLTKKVYVLLNKPGGYITAVSDARGRKTICDLLPQEQPVNPVGRLDLDTTGVILLTNDGELAYRLTHPKFQIEKEYLAHLDHPIKKTDLSQLQSGLKLTDGVTAPCQAFLLSNSRKVRLIIHEGRKRQVRRMFEKLNYHVRKLHRLKFAGLTAGGLNLGEWRELTQKEILDLRRMTGLANRRETK